MALSMTDLMQKMFFNHSFKVVLPDHNKEWVGHGRGDLVLRITLWSGTVKDPKYTDGWR